MPVFGSSPVLDGGDSINAGLVGFWPLGESGGNVAVDLSPNRYAGRLENSVGRAFSLKGMVTTYSGGGSGGTNINLGALNGFASVQTPLAISCWVFPTTFTTDGTIFSHYLNFSGGGQLAKLLIQIGGNLAWYNTDSGGSYQSTTGPAMTLNVWQHVGVSITGPTSGPTVVMWVDNTYTSAVFGATGTPAAGMNHRIGASDFSLSNFPVGWTGNIGPVRAWNRGVLRSQVQRITRDPWAGIISSRRRMMRVNAVAGSWSAPSVWM